jgi:peroxiredoxin Q/BCP
VPLGFIYYVGIPLRIAFYAMTQVEKPTGKKGVVIPSAHFGCEESAVLEPAKCRSLAGLGMTILKKCRCIVQASKVGSIRRPMFGSASLAAMIAMAFGTTALGFFGSATPTAGNLAPDFTLPSQEGTPVSLRDYRGKWVVLYFYPRDLTPGCTVEAHNFQQDQAQYAHRNAVVLGVSVDSVDSHQKFCAKEGLNFKLLADTDKKVSTEYGSLVNLLVAKFSSRHTFIIDPQGKIAKVYTSVSPGKHSREVLAALDELQKQASAGSR